MPADRVTASRVLIIRARLVQVDRAAEGEEADRGGRVDALLFLSRALGARKDKPVFAVEGALRELGLQCYHGTLGDGSGVEGPSGSLKGRSRIASLDMLMNLFFAYYDGPRFRGDRARAIRGDLLI